MKDDEYYEKFYDEVQYPVDSKIHPKAAITKRNQWMVENAELLIAFVEEGRILTRYYSSYSQFHSINSPKSGDITRIDIHLSFEKGASVDEVISLKKKMQDELNRIFENCSVNIIAEED
jgi:hypothetical protein